MKILVIDDIRDNITVIKALIKEAFPDAGFYSADNGKDGIVLAASVDPDVILLDVIMPGMDGFEVCKKLKNDEKLNLIPVVFLTALKTSAENRIKALEAGADGFLTKPVEREELIAQVKTMIKIKNAAKRKRNEKEQLEIKVRQRTIELEEEIKLREKTEEKYRTAFTTIPNAAAISKMDGTFMEINDGFTKTIGYTKEEIIGKPAKALKIWVKPKERNEFIKKLQKQNHIENYEILFRHKNGEIKTGLISANIIYIQNEPYILSITHDITDRKEMEHQLFESEARYRTLIDDVLDTSDVGVFILDANFHVIWINQATEKYFGIKRNEIIGKDKKKLVKEKIMFQLEDSETFAEKVLSAYENNTYVENFICHMLPAKERKDRWLEHWSQPIYSGLYKGGRIEHYTDITQQIEAEKQLKESRERYKLISELTTDYVFENEIMEDGSVGKIWIAGSFEKITGYSPDEFIKIGGWRKILYPPDISVNDRAEKKLFNNHKVSIEVRVFHKDGHLLWVKVHALPIWNKEKNRLVKIIGSVKNITDDKQHRLLQDILFRITKKVLTTNKLNELFTAVKDELSRLMDTRNFMAISWNESTNEFKTLYGEDEYDLVTTYKGEGTLSEKVVTGKKAILLNKKEINTWLKRKKIKSKGAIPEIWMGVPLFKQNKVYGLMIIQDYHKTDAYSKLSLQIFDAVASELSLYISKKEFEEESIRLSQAVMQNPIGIVITDVEGNIEFVNPAFCETTGYDKNELTGQNPRILKSGEQPTSFYKELWDTVLNGKTWQGEFNNKRKNGTLYWAQSIISPVLNEDGEIIRLVATEEDVTDRKEMLEELIKAKEEAQKSDKLKTAFLQNMSHELRTPLNGILGFSSLLTSGDADINSIKEYAGYIQTSGNRLLGLINNIMDISKIEAGVVELNLQPFSLNKLLKDITAFFKRRASEKGVKLEFSPALTDQKSIIISDEVRVNQIIMNLMDNAFKFTEKGNITLSYTLKDKKTLLFSVSDTGRGIGKEHIDKVFERFYQADISLSRGYEGAGLGLPIAKGLVETLGGEMWLESELNKGTKVYFTLPLITDNKKAKAIMTKDQSTVTDQKTVTILVVEDDDTSRYFLKLLLEKEHYKALISASGEEALELIQKDPNISLVLMDIKMPGMNGLEATRKIKEIRPDLPVVAQTAYAFSTDKDTILKAGCDDYISKPLRKDELLKMIKKYISGKNKKG